MSEGEQFQIPHENIIKFSTLLTTELVDHTKIFILKNNMEINSDFEQIQILLNGMLNYVNSIINYLKLDEEHYCEMIVFFANAILNKGNRRYRKNRKNIKVKQND